MEARATAERVSARENSRMPQRHRQREPHEKYDVAQAEIPRGMKAQWIAVTIRGAQNPRLAQFFRAGWRPARAADFPELSGFDVQFPDELIAANVGIRNVNPDDPVIQDGQMLVLRPATLSAEADAEEQRAASRQVEDHLNRLRVSSTRQIGRERTKIVRTGGPADAEFAADDTMETA